MGIILWLLVLEGTRRSLGIPMVIIAIFFTFQALYSDKMFWIFYGPSTTLKSLMLDLFMQDGGNQTTDDDDQNSKQVEA